MSNACYRECFDDDKFRTASRKAQLHVTELKEVIVSILLSDNNNFKSQYRNIANGSAAAHDSRLFLVIPIFRHLPQS